MQDSLKRCFSNIASYSKNYFKINFDTDMEDFIREVVGEINKEPENKIYNIYLEKNRCIEDCLNKILTNINLRAFVEKKSKKLKISFEDYINEVINNREQYIRNSAIFLHEYLHFFHNLSTISGFYEFYLRLYIFLIFRETVDIQGFCQSSKILPHNKQFWLQTYYNIDKTLNGSTLIKDFAIDKISNLKYKFVSHVFKLENEESTVSNIHVSFNYQNESIEYNIGLTAILETIAYEMMLEINPQIEFSGVIPFIPYGILKMILEKKMGSISREFLVKILILSLQFNNPIEVIKYVINDYINYPKVVSSDFLILSIKNKTNIDEYKEAIGNDIRKTLDLFTESPVKKELKRIFDFMQKAINYRNKNDFIEWSLVKNHKLDITLMNQFLKNFNLSSFVCGNKLIGLEGYGYKYEINLFNAMFDFVHRHLTINGEFIPHKKLHPRACLFYDFCRTSPSPLPCFNETLCAFTPYNIYKELSDKNKGCWYSAAICACIGKYDKI